MIEPNFAKVASRGKRPKSDVSHAQARKTALVVAIVLVLLSGWNVYRGRIPTASILGGFGVLLTLVGLFVPVAARVFHRFWMSVAGVLGYINSKILLTVLFYGFFTPYGFVSRMFGRDPLVRRGPKQDTYWIKREYTRQTREQFERLF